MTRSRLSPLLTLLAALAAAPLAAQPGPAPAPAERVHELAEVDVEPALLNAEEVRAVLRRENPVLRSSARIFGSATVRFVVGTSGAVDPARIEIVDATGPEFAEAARKVVASMRWRPGSAAGAAVPVRVTLPLAFVPDGAGDGDGTAPRTGPDEQGAYPMSAVAEPPQIRDRRMFMRLLVRHYPEELRDENVSGTASVRVMVRADGSPDTTRMTVEQASLPGFADAAVEIVKRLRWTPARLDGEPVPVWVTLLIPFTNERPSRGAARPPAPREVPTPPVPPASRPEPRP